MRPLVVGFFAAVSFLPAAFFGVAWAEQAARVKQAADPVLEAIRQAKDAFHSPTEEELASATSEARAARDELARELALEPDGESTGEQAGLDGLAQQLGSGPPDLAQLDALERKLGLNRSSVKGAAYERLRATLTRYLQFLRSAAGPKVVDEYGRRIEQLEQTWLAYQAAPSSDEAVAQLHDAYAWLAERGQAAAALEQVRGAASRPNHLMRASAQFIEMAIVRDLSQPITSDETQEGTRISVRGEVKGKINAKLEPDAEKAAMRVYFRGRGDSKIIARKGKVTVHLRGDTHVEASEVVHFSDQGAGAHSPRVAVKHSTTPYAVSVNRRCRLMRKVVGKLACKVAWKKKAESDRQAAAKARRKLDEQIRTQSAQFVIEANRAIDQFGVFALLRPDPTDKLRLSTTATQLQWSGNYASALQFAAPTDPPSIAQADAALVLQVHESAVNNSDRLLAGRGMNEADFRELVFETFGLIPNDDAIVSGREPATAQMVDRSPITARFDEGLVEVTIRLASVREGRETFDAQPWTVRAAYRPKVDETEIAVVRESLEVQPADAPQADRVKEVLSHFLVEKASRKRSASGSFKLAEKLRLGELAIEGGWLTLVIAPRSPPLETPRGISGGELRTESKRD